MDVIIIGAGGHGRVVLDILRHSTTHKPVGFIDADPARAGTEVSGLPILGPVNLLAKLRHQDIRGAIVGIGDNRTRIGYAQLIAQAGLDLISAIHPTAVISPTAKIGRGVVIAPGAIITTEADISDSAIINSGAVVEHECRIGEAVHICPGAILGGRVEVGPRAFIGLGSRILPCLKIGEDAIIGAGAVVLEDVLAGITMAGVPARKLQQ